MFCSVHVVTISTSSVGDQAAEILHEPFVATREGIAGTFVHEWDLWEILPEKFRVEGKVGTGISA
jgi:hypothetical protein